MMPPSCRVIPLTVTLLVLAAPIAGQQLQYPPAPRSAVVDNYFGRMVQDPYRSLEDPDAPATAAWVQAENALTGGYVSRLGGVTPSGNG